MLYASARAPGNNTKRVQFGYSGSTYALVDYGLEGQVPIEVLQDGMNGPGIDHAAMAIRKVSNIMALRLEKMQQDIDFRLSALERGQGGGALSGGAMAPPADGTPAATGGGSQPLGAPPRPLGQLEAGTPEPAVPPPATATTDESPVGTVVWPS